MIGASLVGLLIALISAGAAGRAAAATGAAAEVFVSSDLLHGGEPLTIGYFVRNPSGGPSAQLYVGALLPDGTLRIFPGKNGASPSASDGRNPPVQHALDQFPPPAGALNTIGPTFEVPPGFTQTNAAFIQMEFPRSGMPAGAYQFFAALLSPGALQDNQLSPDEMLAVSTKPLMFVPEAGFDPTLQELFRRLRETCRDEIVALVDQVLSRLSGVGFQAFYEDFVAKMQPNLTISFGGPLRIPVDSTMTFLAEPFGVPLAKLSPPGPTAFCDEIPFEVAELEIALSPANIAVGLNVDRANIAQLRNPRSGTLVPLADGKMTMELEIEGLSPGTAQLSGKVEFTHVVVKAKIRVPTHRIDLNVLLAPLLEASISTLTFDINEQILVEEARVFRGPLRAAGASASFSCGVAPRPATCFFETIIDGSLELNLRAKTYTILAGSACSQTVFADDGRPPIRADCSGALLTGFPVPVEVTGTSFSGARLVPHAGNPEFKHTSVVGQILDDTAVGTFTAEPLGDCRPFLPGPCGAIGTFALPRVESPPTTVVVDVAP